MLGWDLLGPAPSGFEGCELAGRSQVVFFAWPGRSRICSIPFIRLGLCNALQTAWVSLSGCLSYLLCKAPAHLFCPCAHRIRG